MVYNGTRYLVLFGSEKYDSIYDRIKDLISVKSGNSYDSLPLEKTITLRNVIILLMSVWNKDKNNCYNNIFLEKFSHEIIKK